MCIRDSLRAADGWSKDHQGHWEEKQPPELPSLRAAVCLFPGFDLQDAASSLHALGTVDPRLANVNVVPVSAAAGPVKSLQKVQMVSGASDGEPYDLVVVPSGAESRECSAETLLWLSQLTDSCKVLVTVSSALGVLSPRGPRVLHAANCKMVHAKLAAGLAYLVGADAARSMEYVRETVHADVAHADLNQESQSEESPDATEGEMNELRKQLEDQKEFGKRCLDEVERLREVMKERERKHIQELGSKHDGQMVRIGTLEAQLADADREVQRLRGELQLVTTGRLLHQENTDRAVFANRAHSAASEQADRLDRENAIIAHGIAEQQADLAFGSGAVGARGVLNLALDPHIQGAPPTLQSPPPPVSADMPRLPETAAQLRELCTRSVSALSLIHI
eukprot:TRINITY_DN4972_c0_g1_i1.p1 TRINITY_DN4972_c0_g1~~TRINITY_DN4972_c0_g1_i1.p1  ORF type:complete len:394 (+),score=109.86 TRINITY_DN4972_c0_g1_i1:69-1250(+)